MYECSLMPPASPPQDLAPVNPGNISSATIVQTMGLKNGTITNSVYSEVSKVATPTEAAAASLPYSISF